MIFALRCAIHSDTDFGRRSRISTMTPRPSFSIARMAASIRRLPSLPASTPMQVGERIDRVHAHQHGARRAEVALDEGQMLARLNGRLVDVQIEAPGRCCNLRLGNRAHEMLVAQAVGDQILDGADLEAVALCEGDEVRHARHGAVVVHDLADDGGRVEPGKARKIDGGFRMSRRGSARRPRAR